jgi:KUP system potassium uptake protein
MSTVTVDEHRAAPRVDQPTTAAAALTAMGIVYGDLGTQSSLHSAGGRANLRRRLVRIGALGSLSLIFWLLIITISTKCWLFVMRADNHGEAAFSR